MQCIHTALKHSKKHLNFLVSETYLQQLCLNILACREVRSHYHLKLCLIVLNIQRELIENGMVEQVVEKNMIECLKSILLIEAENIDSYLLTGTLDLLNAIVHHKPSLLARLENDN